MVTGLRWGAQGRTEATGQARGRRAAAGLSSTQPPSWPGGGCGARVRPRPVAANGANAGCALCLVDQGRQTDRRACSKGAANEAGHVDWRSLVSQGVSEAGDAPAATPGRCRVAGPGPVGSVRADEELGQEGHQQGVQADLLLLRQKGGVLPGRLSSRMRAAVPGSVCMRSAAWLNCSTTRTTPPRPVPCTPTCDGATPTPATPTSSPPNAANAPASAARKASAGADAPSSPLHNPQPGEVTRSPH